MLHIDFIKYWARFLGGFYKFLSTFKMSSPSRDGDDITIKYDLIKFTLDIL